MNMNPFLSKTQEFFSVDPKVFSFTRTLIKNIQYCDTYITRSWTRACALTCTWALRLHKEKLLASFGHV